MNQTHKIQTKARSRQTDRAQTAGRIQTEKHTKRQTKGVSPGKNRQATLKVSAVIKVFAPGDRERREKIGWKREEEKTGWQREEEKIGWQREEEKTGWQREEKTGWQREGEKIGWQREGEKTGWQREEGGRTLLLNLADSTSISSY